MADWGYIPENLARLVDLMTAWLNYEYASWTADPDEVEEERKKRKRAKVKPPPRPLIQPVAARPPSLHEQLEEIYAEDAVKHQLPEVDASPQMVDSETFDALIDHWF